VATVVVDEVVAAVDDFPGDEEGGALGLRAVGFAGVETVHAFVVDGIDVRDFLLEGLDIDERDENDGASDLRGVEIGDEFFDGDDGDVFGAVGTGDECENFAGLGPVYDDDGDAGGIVDTSGNFEGAGGFLVGGGRSGADSEGGLGMSQKRSEQQGYDNPKANPHKGTSAKSVRIARANQLRQCKDGKAQTLNDEGTKSQRREGAAVPRPQH